MRAMPFERRGKRGKESGEEEWRGQTPRNEGVSHPAQEGPKDAPQITLYGQQLPLTIRRRDLVVHNVQGPASPEAVSIDTESHLVQSHSGSLFFEKESGVRGKAMTIAREFCLENEGAAPEEAAMAFPAPPRHYAPRPVPHHLVPLSCSTRFQQENRRAFLNQFPGGIAVGRFASSVCSVQWESQGSRSRGVGPLVTGSS